MGRSDWVVFALKTIATTTWGRRRWATTSTFPTSTSSGSALPSSSLSFFSLVSFAQSIKSIIQDDIYLQTRSFFGKSLPLYMLNDLVQRRQLSDSFQINGKIHFKNQRWLTKEIGKWASEILSWRWTTSIIAMHFVWPIYSLHLAKVTSHDEWSSQWGWGSKNPGRGDFSMSYH